MPGHLTSEIGPARQCRTAVSRSTAERSTVELRRAWSLVPGSNRPDRPYERRPLPAEPEREAADHGVEPCCRASKALLLTGGSAMDPWSLPDSIGEPD